jgi:hypothetical protein
MKTKEEKQIEVQRIAEQLQDSCHLAVNAMIEGTNKNISYQDATNTFIFLQLAIVKQEFQELKDLISELASGS